MGVLCTFFLGYYNSASRTNLLHDSVFRASRIFQCNIVTSRVSESVNRFFFQNSAASITLCNTNPFGCTSRRNSCYRRARSVPGGRNSLCPYQAPASFTVPGFLALSVAGCCLVDDRITALLVSQGGDAFGFQHGSAIGAFFHSFAAIGARSRYRRFPYAGDVSVHTLPDCIESYGYSVVGRQPVCSPVRSKSDAGAVRLCVPPDKFITPSCKLSGSGQLYTFRILYGYGCRTARSVVCGISHSVGVFVPDAIKLDDPIYRRGEIFYNFAVVIGF